MDERRCRDHLEQNDLICEHIRLVRERPGYDATVPLVFIPENMTGFNHTTMESAVVGLPNVQTYYQNGGAIPGVRKGPYESRAYTRITLELMYRREIMIDRHWLSPTAARHREGERTGRRKIWEEVRDQLMRYGYDEKGKLTGKYDGQFRDDLCIAFMMLAYWSQAIEKPGAGNPAAHLQRLPPGSTPATERARFAAMQPRTTGVPTHFPPGYRAGQPLNTPTHAAGLVHRVQY